MKIETYIRCTGAQGTPVDASNLPAAVNPPILCLGMSVELKIHFFDGEAEEQMDAEAFEDIGSWRLSVDTDYSQATEPILRWTTGISVDEDGTVLVAIPNVSSDKLVAALGVKQSGEYIAELMGYEAGQAVPAFVVQFPFNVYNRIDLEGGSESIPVSSGYYTNSQVDALLASAYEFQFSADGESWHDTQAGTDRWFRIRNGSVAGAQWSDPIAIPAGRDGQDGEDGISPVISVGNVSTGAPGTSASVTSRVTSGGTMYLDFTIPRGSNGSGTVGSGNLIFTSGGTQVATYNPQTNSDVTVPLPEGGSGSGGGSGGGTIGSANLTITSGASSWTFNANATSDVIINLGSGSDTGGSGGGISNITICSEYGHIISAISSAVVISGGTADLWVPYLSSRGYTVCMTASAMLWQRTVGQLNIIDGGISSGYAGAVGDYDPAVISGVAVDPVSGYVNTIDSAYVIVPAGTNWRLLHNSGTAENPAYEDLALGPELAASGGSSPTQDQYMFAYGGDGGTFELWQYAVKTSEYYARQEHTHYQYTQSVTLNSASAGVTHSDIISGGRVVGRAVNINALTGITVNGSSSGVTLSSGVADLTITGGGTQTITSIPAASSAYTLSTAENGGVAHYTHIPNAATVYTLPAVPDATKDNAVVLDVKFASTTSATFSAASGSVVLLDSLTISSGDIVEYLCRYDSLQSAWVVAGGYMNTRS